MTIKQRETRFRAYQLGTAGSSFSYFNGSNFTLIEARYTDTNKESIGSELRLCNLDEIKYLHITSWGQDHCVPSQLEEIIKIYNPIKIEYPGYLPHTESGKESLKIINHFKENGKGSKKAVQITPKYICNYSAYFCR